MFMKRVITISISDNLLEKLDVARDGVSRSKFVCSILEKEVK